MLIISPTDTLDQIHEKIQMDDVFYLPDHFNLPGIPNHKIIADICTSNLTDLDKIIIDNPNKLFFFSNHPQFIDVQPDNCKFLPLYFRYTAGYER